MRAADDTTAATTPPSESERRSWLLSPITLAVVTGVAGTVAATLLGLVPGVGPGDDSSSDGETGTDELVRISAPTDPTVTSPFEVTGTLLVDPGDREVWLASQAVDDTRFHPQVARCVVGSGSAFHCPPTYIGSDDRPGQGFDVHVLLADSAAVQAFEDYEASRPPGEYPGMSELPDGAQTAHILTVVRS